MKNLYAPWREDYAISTSEKKKTKSEKDCVFCIQLKSNKDEEHFILGRFKNSTILLNRYPYNAGHLLIIPTKHTGALDTLNKETQDEIMQLISKSITILKKELKADGFNVGLNIGKGSGGSIPGHIHFHILPRWLGDTNFLPTLAETKQISSNLSAIYKKLYSVFLKIKLN